jgi:hypothetical protein
MATTSALASTAVVAPPLGTKPTTPTQETAVGSATSASAQKPAGLHTATVLAKSLQRIGAPAGNTPPRAPDAPPAGRYQRVIVIDEFNGGGISINPSDKVPDLSHGEVVRGILNAGINGGRQPGQAGYVPIERVALEGFAQSKDAATPVFAAMQQVLQTAPRGAQGQPDLRGVAINLSQTIYGGSGLTPSEVRTVQAVLAAGADLFISQSNISHGWPNLLGAVADPPGGGQLFFVGGSDSKMFRNPDSNVPSTQNAWTSFSVPGTVNRVVNSDFLIRAVDENADGITDGFDINGDGRSDFFASQVKDTSALDRPFVDREIGAMKVGLEELEALDDNIATDFAAQVARDPTLAANTYKDQQRALQVATLIRDKAAAGLKGKLISVDDAIEFNLGPANETVPTALLGSLFRMDQQAPRGAGLDPRKLYVSVEALLGGELNSRYRDDLVFFTAGADGRVSRVTDTPGMSGHLPSANSWAAPYALVSQFHQR